METLSKPFSIIAVVLLIINVALSIAILTFVKKKHNPVIDSEKTQMMKENDSLRLQLHLQPFIQQDSILQNDLNKDSIDIDDAVDFFNAKRRSK